MATQISNQATITFNNGASQETLTSNISTTMLQGPLSVNKSSLNTYYRHESHLTYILSMANNGLSVLQNIQITDDLASYTLPGPITVTPLTYTGPAQLYINGVFSTALTPTINAHSMVFTIPTLAAGANAMIMYKAMVNDYALLSIGSGITNDTVFASTGMLEDMFATHTIPVDNYADVRIIKSMAPNPVTDGSILTYTFTMYNYGNIDATNVVLTDTFSPAPTGLTVMLDGVAVPPGDYDYVGGVFTVPDSMSLLTITIPAATFEQDPLSGSVAITPGITILTVSGTI